MLRYSEWTESLLLYFASDIMKYQHVLYPVTTGGKLRQLLSQYQFDLAWDKTCKDPKQVAEVLLWFDSQNESLKQPSKRVCGLITQLWTRYCRGEK